MFKNVFFKLLRSLTAWLEGHSQGQIIGQCFGKAFQENRRLLLSLPCISCKAWALNVVSIGTEKPIGVVAEAKGERWAKEILYNDANYRIERQRQTHISFTLSGTALKTEKIYKISRNWVNGRKEVVVKKYRFAVFFSPFLWLKAGPFGIESRNERATQWESFCVREGFWCIYTAEGCQRTDMTTWMPLLWTTFPQLTQ